MAIAFVQAAGQVTGSSPSVTLTGVAAGDLLIVICGGGNTVSAPSGISTTAGSTSAWTTLNANGGGTSQGTFSAVALSSGTITISITLGSSSCQALMAEFSGVASLDSATAPTANVSSTATSNAGTPAVANELFVAGFGAQVNFTGLGGSGWSPLGAVGGHPAFGAYKIESGGSTAPQTASATLGSSATWIASLAMFEPTPNNGNMLLVMQ